MKGTLVNAAAVVVGSAVGLLLQRGIPEKYQHTIMQGLAMSVALIGVQMALKTQNILIVIISMVIGAILGEWLGIEQGLNRIGDYLTVRLGGRYGNVGQGFVTASLVYCVGAMAVVGGIQDGITGDASTLYAKSMLDGVSAVVFSATMGIGVALSSIAILLYQGTITLLASSFGAVLTEHSITEMTAVGGLLIVGISLRILDIKQVNVANMLPTIPIAAFIAIVWT